MITLNIQIISLEKRAAASQSRADAVSAGVLLKHMGFLRQAGSDRHGVGGGGRLREATPKCKFYTKVPATSLRGSH